ncbi:MAG TPA: deoxyribonuclease IV [Geopsychrobacteraceae bacterium]|nr:deoxyribonuclease IV [Geopsychrobacteraceae bacterium]
MTNKTRLRLGTHVSIAGGLYKAFSRGEKVDCTAIQVFTKNANRWQTKPLRQNEIDAFKDARQKSSIDWVAAHDSYLINLASPEAEKRLRSIEAFIVEVERCAALGIEFLVMHPGAHMGNGIDNGLNLLAESFRSIVKEVSGEVTVLLENTAGQGTCLGDRFEHLATVLDKIPEGKFGVCLDTCHAFAAGYDLSNAEGYRTTMDEFDRLIGFEKLQLIHANDSKKPLGSQVDRHQHIGKGEIGPEGFAAMMQDSRLQRVPKIIELPPGDNNCFDLENLGMLRKMAGDQG